MPQNLVSTSYAKRKKKVAILKLVLIVFIFAIILFCIIKMVNYSSWQITKVVISGDKFSDKAAIISAVEKKITGSYLFIPKRFVLLYPKEIIKKDLIEEFKTVESVIISANKQTNEGYSLNIVLNERKPEIIWCEIIADLSNENDENDKINKEICFYVDRDGSIFSEAPNFTENVFLKLTGPVSVSSSTIDNVIGLTLPVADKLSDFKKFANDLLKSNYIVKQIDYDAEGIYNVKFVVNFSTLADRTYESTILLDNRTDISRATENFLISAMEYELNRTTKILEYADLRFGNNIVFKWKNLDLADPI